METHGGPQAREGGGSARVGGDVVSTVDGHPITLEEVRELAALGMSRDEALRMLQAELVLIGEARRRGFARDRAVARVGRQAAVQALLDAEASAQRASEEELRAAYEAAGDRFRHGERRASFHVLARLPKQPSPEAEAAAEAFAREMVGELEQRDPAEVRARYHREKREHFSIVAQNIPPADRDASYDPAYLEAIFGLPGTGVVPKPVRSSFGWHAIAVTGVVPAKHISFEQARDTLRSELLLEKRRTRVEALLDELRAAQRVELSDGVREALAEVAP